MSRLSEVKEGEGRLKMGYKQDGSHIDDPGGQPDFWKRTFIDQTLIWAKRGGSYDAAPFLRARCRVCSIREYGPRRDV